MTGLRRNIEKRIRKLLAWFPVVVIVGARQVGKTTLARVVGREWRYLDLENPADFDRLSADPLFFFSQFPRQLVIDEAQAWPELFAVLRGVIDQRREEKGRFLLTGSSSPALLTQIAESLAGRVAVVELGPLKANEYYRQPRSSFYSLFSGALERQSLDRLEGAPPHTVEQMQTLWLDGGYPEPLLHDDRSFRAEWMAQYRDTYLYRDIARLFPRLNRLAYRRFLTLLGQLSGTIVNRRDLARSIEVSEKTVREYLEIAEGTFLWRSLPSFERDLRKSVVKMPKGYLRDSGLRHHILRIADLEMLYGHPVVGTSFESFVIEELLRGLESLDACNWQASYYRTRNGAEIDLILEGDFGLLPVEIKYGAHTPIKTLRTLGRFVRERGLPFGLLINQSDEALWLSEEVFQVPVGWL